MKKHFEHTNCGLSRLFSACPNLFRTVLKDRPSEGQYYNYCLAEVTVSPRTVFQIDKIVCTHNQTVLNNILSTGEDTKIRSTHVNATDIEKI